ncbi:MAG: TolC family protein [Nitrospinae bacterium]|nr:TolC family protein [Nitrospinota bacterium]
MAACAAVFIMVSPVMAEEAAPAPSSPPVQEFKTYVRRLLEKHPAQKALALEAEAKGKMPSQEGALPNPQLTVGVMDLPTDSLAFDKEDMTRKTIGITQAFPAPGKRDLRKRVAEDEAEMARQMAGEKRLDLILEARLAFYELRYLLKAREAVQSNKDILKEFIDIALTKYSVGQGVQQDVLAAQIEYSKMAEYFITLEQQLAVLAKNLNIAADLPPDTDWSQPVIGPLTEIAGSEEAMLERTVEDRPMFRQLRAALKKAEDGAELARRELAPDYAVSFSYSQRDDGPAGVGAHGLPAEGPTYRSDLVSLELMLDLPLYKDAKQNQMIAQSQIMADKARMDIEAEKLAMRRELAELMEMQRKNMRLLALYDTGLLPQAQQAVEAAVSAYRVNKVDFRWLVMNQTENFQYRIQREQMEYELYATRARLLRTLGDEVEAGNE